MLSKKIAEQRKAKLEALESRKCSPFDIPDYWKKSQSERMEMVKKFIGGAKSDVQKDQTFDPDAAIRAMQQEVEKTTGTAGTKPPRPGRGTASAASGAPASTGHPPKPDAREARPTGGIPRAIQEGAGHRPVPRVTTTQVSNGPDIQASGFLPRVPRAAQNQPADSNPIGERLVQKHIISHPAEPVVLNERGLRYTLIHSGMGKELNAYIARMWESYRYAFDFEANTDDPLNDRDILDVAGISFSILPGEAIYLPINHWGYGGNWGIEVLEKFRGLFESKQHLKIPFNMSYENQVLHLLGYDLKLPIFDPFLALNLLKTTPKASAGQLGLKVNVKEKFNYEMITFDEITKKRIIDGYDKNGAAKYKEINVKFNELMPDPRVLEYTGADSDWALQLADLTIPALKEQGLYELCTEVDIPLQKCLDRMAFVGWHMDLELVEELKVKCQQMIDKYELAVLDDIKRQMRFPAEQPLLGPKYWHESPIGWRQDLEAAKKNKRIVVEDCLTDTDAAVYANTIIRDQAINGEIFGYTYKVNAKKKQTTFSVRVWDEKAFFNLGSWQQLAELWYDVLKLPPADPKNPRGTDEEIVGKLKKRNPLPMFESIIEWRGYAKIMSTYLIGYSSRAHPETHRVHTTLDQVYVRTGRFASGNPNLQNAPRADNDSIGVRNTFVAPNIFYIYVPGDWNPMEPSVYIHCDYSQIELRVFAHYSKDPNMTDAFMKGQDVHSRTAWQMYRLGEQWVHPKTGEVRAALTVEQVPDFAKDIRNYAKTINFGIIYGRQAKALAEQLGISEQEGQKLLKLYYETYPGVQSYMQDMIAFARMHGYSETMFGRRRYIPEIMESNKWKRAEAERQAINTPVQGSAAEIIKLAMIRIDQFTNGDWDDLGTDMVDIIRARTRMYTERPNWMKLTMQIHDELIAEVPISKAIEGAWLMKNIMELPIEGFDVPIVAEADIAYRWAQKQGLDFNEDGSGAAVKVKVQYKKEDGEDQATAEAHAQEKLQKKLKQLGPDLDLFRRGGVEVKTKWEVA